MNFNLVEQREDRNNEWIKKAHTKEGREKMVLCSEDPGPDTRLRPGRPGFGFGLPRQAPDLTF